jgi:TolA-binding protein
MATKQKLTKQQIKQDKFITTIFKAQEYFTGHTSRFLIAIGAIVVIAAAVFFITSRGQAREQEADEIFGRANVEFRSGNFQLAAVDFQNILDNYGGTESAKLASYYIAVSYFSLQNYDEAEKYYRLHYDKYRYNDMLSANALNGIAECLKAKGSLKEAADKFFEVYQKYPDSYIVPDCIFNGAECYASAGDTENSKKLFDIYVKMPGQGQRALELRQYLVEHGVLDPTTSTYD